MPLDGTAWATQASAFATYLEGDVPLALVSVTIPGSSIPFIHDERTEELVDTEAGGLVEGTLAVCTRTPIVVGHVYSYGGASWTVESEDAARAAGANDWPFRYVLTRHAV